MSEPDFSTSVAATAAKRMSSLLDASNRDKMPVAPQKETIVAPAPASPAPTPTPTLPDRDMAGRFLKPGRQTSPNATGDRTGIEDEIDVGK